jgi:tripartite-type tricarboxylate transporter receptor subunit TctC
MNDERLASSRRRRLMLAATGSALLGAASSSFAQGKGIGDGPVRIIVPFTPGTTPDICARVIGPKLSQRLGQPVIADNRPGASGIIGMEMVAKAPPDGHTVMVSTNTALTLPYFYSKVPFDVIQSFQPIGMIGYTNYALTAHPSLPVSNPKELIAYLKAHPGEVTYASPGRGTLHHLCMEKIVNATGVQISHIPYKGTAGATTDLIAGHIKLMIMPLHLAVPLQADGKLRILGSTRGERDPAFPKITPLQDGGIASFDEDGWFAVWAPKGMPADLVALYNGALREALASPDTKATMDKQGISLKPGSPEDLRKIAQAEYEKWGRVVRDAQIKPE